MRNVGMVISYDGTAYNGFQTQPAGNTIQDKLEEAIFKLTGEKVKITSSGRTDAGVHARKHVINFRTESMIPIERWCIALNSRLPYDIITLQAWEAPLNFHARRDARKKIYRYTIFNSRMRNIFERWTQYHHPGFLDIDAMQKALKLLEGNHDFSSFCTMRSQKDSNIRIVYEAEIELEEREIYPGRIDKTLHIFISGNGFLHNMVRIIVGTVLQVGEGKYPAERISDILLAKDRMAAGPTAMAHGLMLWEVFYD